MPYCTEADLLVKDVLQAPGSTRQDWVDRAAEEMDSYLGYRYVIPLIAGPQFQQIIPHEVIILKQINAKLASGRYILAQAANEEDDRLHAYGWSLVQDAIGQLLAIKDGRVDLRSVATLSGDQGDESNRLPGVTNEDEESLLLGWENTVMRGVPWYSRPGAL